MKHLLTALVLGVGIAGDASAAIDAYRFQREDDRQRYVELTRELRCPKCQNQDIADSNAPIAADLRREIHRLLEEGRSDGEIVAFMVDRYGEFVRYKPELRPRTWLLWFGPVALLLMGGAVISVIVTRRRRLSQAAQADILSDEERARLDRLLDEHH